MQPALWRGAAPHADDVALHPALAVHGLAMCWVATGIHVYGSMNMTVEGGEEEFSNKVVT